MSRRNKRLHGQEEEFVDDLAIAASYAVAKAPIAATTADDNEIDLDEADNSAIGEGGEGKTEFLPQEADQDDDESDVDLEEELKKMTEKETEEETERTTVTSIPKTVNEIDPYHADLDKLRTEFELDITLEEREKLLLEQQQQQNLGPAGRIQHYMASERTMVVQSQGNALLEEGVLLLLKVPRSEGQGERIVPLGRILEVFGPVSQPLYSLRIPEAIVNEEEKTAVKEVAVDTPAKESKDETNQPSLSANASSRDPWAPGGEYSQLIKGNASQWTAYYPLEGAKLLNPAAIFKISGRGSDASNVFDEEVTNPNEVDYSDDEEERMAKRKGKARRGQGGGQRNDARDRGPPRHSTERVLPPHGFHAPGNFVIPQQNQGTSPAGYPPFASPPSMHPSYATSAYPPPPPPPPPPQPPKEEESDTVYYDIS